ncbi:sugar porter family MFS transporter [Salinicola tamaricis]|uniref:sugar porter family MFS transporter n=1 Tax=Salinicola tamaricis TaxID=1771309 RepID=UPI000D0A1CA2|nr:sugar porter family MFS transporter [Salinicola tamaricis]
MNDDTSHYDKRRRSATVIATACVAALGGFLFGFDSGVINGTVDGLRQAFGSSSVGTGFAVASMLLGCAAGAFFAGRLADWAGRRVALLIAAAFFIISAWGSGVADTTATFVIFRLLGGLAVGAASIMSPAYISEIAPAAIRGRLTTIQQIAILIGLFMAFVSNYIVSNLAGSSTAVFWWGYEAWRWMFWMEILPAAIFLFSLLAIPESPRYLVAAGRAEQASRVLSRILAPEAARQRLADIREAVSEQRRPRIGDIVNPDTGGLYRVVWIGIVLAVFQQLVGINVVFYYGAVLWQAVGFSENDALMINIISGGVSILACVVSLFFVDRIGRKPLLWMGSIGMALTLITLIVAFASGHFINGKLELSGPMGVIALIAANAYVCVFNATWGPVLWVMLGEMFPYRLRGSGLAMAGLGQWLANFGITLSFPVLLSGIGLAAAYGLYAACALLSFFFVWHFVAETKGRELEEMGYA